MTLSTEEVFAVYRKWYEKLVTYAVCILNSTDLAEDAVQDVAFNIVKLQPSFESENHCKAYLYSAVKNRSLYIKRRNKRYVSLESGTGRIVMPANEDAFATIDWINRIFEDEEPTIKELFLRHILYKDNISELAREANMKSNTLQHKFRSLRERAKKHYIRLLNLVLLIKLTVLFLTWRIARMALICIG